MTATLSLPRRAKREQQQVRQAWSAVRVEGLLRGDEYGRGHRGFAVLVPTRGPHQGKSKNRNQHGHAAPSSSPRQEVLLGSVHIQKGERRRIGTSRTHERALRSEPPQLPGSTGGPCSTGTLVVAPDPPPSPPSPPQAPKMVAAKASPTAANRAASGCLRGVSSTACSWSVEGWMLDHCSDKC